jgi:autophagy-related protein 5
MITFGLLNELIQENVWDTMVPFKVEMSPKDLISSNIPLPLYYTLPRVSYFSSIYKDIAKKYEDFLQINLNELWLEYNGIPLKWQYPIGVLVDSLDMDTSNGPIALTIRLREYPKNLLLEYNNASTKYLSYHYLAALKEADILKYPLKPKILNKMLPELVEKLLHISENNNPKDITEYRKIMNFPDKIEKYPVKLFFCRTNLILTKAATLPEGEEKKYTIKDFLIEALGNNIYNKVRDQCKILIHGIEVVEDECFLFYYFNFNYMDTFLYISFVDKKIESNNP